MIPAIAPPSPVPTGPAPAASQKAEATVAPDATSASRGETAAAALRAETAQAIDPARQAALLSRLRDEETAETTDRPGLLDDFAGPEPTFKESPLERQARVALDPPEIAIDLVASDEARDPRDAPDDDEPIAADAPPAFKDPPPTPTERAEVSFAETKGLGEKGAPEVDLAR